MNGILVVNKEKNMTSHDVVNIVRKALKIKKVGHGGTLDPNVTGVMLILVGRATKILDYLQSYNKEYIGILKLGSSTTTEDSDGEVIDTKPIKYPTKEEIEKVFASFLHAQKQIPPMYSSVKINGKKLYEYARKGEVVERQPRDIYIYELELLDYHDDEIKFRCLCSAGTYIRTLCVDIAARLGNLGHMSSLVRSKYGAYDVSECYSIDDIKKLNFELTPIEKALSHLPKIEYDEDHIKNGRPIKSELIGKYLMVNKDQKALAIYEGKNGFLKCLRGIWS